MAKKETIFAVFATEQSSFRFSVQSSRAKAGAAAFRAVWHYIYTDDAARLAELGVPESATPAPAPSSSPSMAYLTPLALQRAFFFSLSCTFGYC